MRKNILAPLFDIRPTTASGEVDAVRIKPAMNTVVDLRGKRRIPAHFTPILNEGLLRREVQSPSGLTQLVVVHSPAPEKRGEPTIPPRGTPQIFLAEQHQRKDKTASAGDIPERQRRLKVFLLQALARFDAGDRHRGSPFLSLPVPEPGPLMAPQILVAEQASVSLPSGEEPPAPRGAQETERGPGRRALLRDTGVTVPSSQRRRLAGERTPAARSAVSSSPDPGPRAPSPLTAMREAKRAEPPAPKKVLHEVQLVAPPRPLPSHVLPPHPRRERILKTTLALLAGITLVSSGLAVVGFLVRSQRDAFTRAEALVGHLNAGGAALKAAHWREATSEFQGAGVLLDGLERDVGRLGKAGIVEARSEDSPGSLIVFLRLGQEATKVGIALAGIGEALLDPRSWQGTLAGSGTLLARLAEAETELSQARSLVEAIEEAGRALNPDLLPARLREKFFGLTDNLAELKHFLERGHELVGTIRTFLGGERPRRYLIVLQNSSELRPTGGFPGTYGLAEFREGRLATFFLDGIYNPDGQLTIEVVPPRVLQRVSPFWGMRDAGWFFDFPTSARKFAWFYEKAGGPAVDGVIAVTPRFVERLLALTGPFSMPQYGQERIDHENFIEILQYEVEADFNPRLGNPKKILSDLAPEFLARLAGLTPAKGGEVLQALRTSLAERDIQVSFFDQTLQRVIDAQDWSGRIKASDDRHDYLAVVHANIAGGKADWVTDDEVLQEISILPDGSITKSVSITRRHQGGGTPYAWWNAPNKDYLRVLVPRGATLLAATGFTEREPFSRTPKKKTLLVDPDVARLESGFRHEPRYALDLFREHDKDAFAGWLMVPPGESRTVTLRYRLPASLGEGGRFEVFVQKQAGTAQTLTTRLLFSETWEVLGAPAGGSLRRGLLEITEPLSRDIAYHLQFVRP